MSEFTLLAARRAWCGSRGKLWLLASKVSLGHLMKIIVSYRLGCWVNPGLQRANREGRVACGRRVIQNFGACPEKSLSQS